MYQADLHTHTVASVHAYGTIMENAKAAKEKGLKVIAMTDHGPGIGGPEPYFFVNLRVIPEELFGVRVLKSVEANIMDVRGNLDLPPEILGSLDLVVAGFHNPEILELIPERRKTGWCTKAMCAAIRDPNVDIIAHPGNPVFPVDIEQVVRTAAKYGKALEINNNSFIARPLSRGSCGLIARECAKHGTFVSIASDAHFPFSIGDVSQAAEIAREAGIKEHQIVNATLENLRAFLEVRAFRLPMISANAAG